MTQASQPIGPDELDGLFAGLFAADTRQNFALAVSGGSDSTALMVLVAEWLGRGGQPAARFTVLTVDHRLRPEAAAEAEAVARRAAALGFAHATLIWRDEKPTTGLQAAARRVRYRLMADYARAHGIGTIATAHTADDQAETLLMRLARGSGLDGLSAMATLTLLEDAGRPPAERLRIARPLLSVAKARLQASLRQRGIDWIEDPSNAAPAFERPRLRAARAELDRLGLTSPMLASSARRLQQARAALEHWVAGIFDPAAGIVRIDPCGFFSIDLARLRALPQEIVVRVLARAVAAAGGSGEPVPLAALEAIVEELLGEASGRAWTLARAKLAVLPERLLVERETGREPLALVTLEAGQAALWDGRFRVAARAGCSATVEVGALGVEGLREVRERVPVAPSLPVASLRALPGFRRGSRLLAVPPLGIWADAEARRELAAEFVGLADLAREP